jgi:ribosomal protein S18 acetylase RimI-like enzyme
MEPNLEIRHAKPGDAAEVRSFLERLSPDSRWLRYHSAAPKIRSWMVDAVVDGDGRRHDALIATVEGRVVGVAEWGKVRPEDAVADVGIVVDECCRRRGIARALLGRLTADANEHGIEAFHASVLSENRPTISLVQRVAPERDVSFEGQTVEVLVPLRATA